MTTTPEAPAMVLPPKSTAPKNFEANLSDILTQQAVVIEPKVSYPRFELKQTPDDMALTEGQFDPKLMRMGTIFCLGERQKELLEPFAKATSAVSKVINKYGHEFMGRKLIPNQTLDKVVKELEEEKGRFEESKLAFLSAWPEIRTRAIQEIEGYSLSNPNMTPEKAESLINRVKRKLPPVHVLEKMFKIHYHPWSCATAPEVTTKLTTLNEQRAILDARNKLIKESIQAGEGEVVDFIKEVTRSIREQAVDVIEEMIDSIGSGKWNQKTLNRFQGIYDALQGLSFAGGEVTDADLMNRLKQFEDQYLSTSAKEYKKDGAKFANLQDGLKALRSATQELAATDADEAVEQFRKIGTRNFLMGE